MRITATAATVTILVVLFAGKVSAWEAESGNELYELLVSKSPYSRFVAEGYILGVIDTTHTLNRVWHLPVQWTIPAKATKRQVFEAVKKYLDQHPEERDKTAYLLVNIALGHLRNKGLLERSGASDRSALVFKVRIFRGGDAECCISLSGGGV